MFSLQFAHDKLYVVRDASGWGYQYIGIYDREAALNLLIQRAKMVFHDKHLTVDGQIFTRFQNYGYDPHYWNCKEDIENDVDMHGFMLKEFDLPEVKSNCEFVCYVDCPEVLYVVCKPGTGYEDEDTIIAFTTDVESIDRTQYSFFKILMHVNYDSTENSF